MLTAAESHRPGAGMAGLVLDLARPYRGWLVLILAAMLVETIAGLAGPWPLKIVIDDVVGHDRVPAWAAQLLGQSLAMCVQPAGVVHVVVRPAVPERQDGSAEFEDRGRVAHIALRDRPSCRVELPRVNAVRRDRQPVPLILGTQQC